MSEIFDTGSFQSIWRINFYNINVDIHKFTAAAAIATNKATAKINNKAKGIKVKIPGNLDLRSKYVIRRLCRLSKGRINR